MRSFRVKRDDRTRIFLALSGSVESKLRELFAKRAEAGELTQASLAEKLGIGRSAVCRRLNGGENMTLKTIADLVWGMGGCIEVDIFDPADHPHRNHVVTVRRETPVCWSASPTSVVRSSWSAESVQPRITVTGDARLAP